MVLKPPSVLTVDVAARVVVKPGHKVVSDELTKIGKVANGSMPMAAVALPTQPNGSIPLTV